MYNLTFSDGCGPFPPHETADPSGLLAIGATLSADRLVYAYQNGIFPWYNEGEDILWYSPPERCVFTRAQFHVSRSFKKRLNKKPFTITGNKAFHSVIEICAGIERKGQEGTWIHDEMVAAYSRLYELGWARSYEVWQDGQLAGGIYGVRVGKVFCGESMFSRVPDASKFALWHILNTGEYDWIDAQIPNPHLMELGALMIPRRKFLEILHAQKNFEK